jgi:hypothetical protein
MASPTVWKATEGDAVDRIRTIETKLLTFLRDQPWKYRWMLRRPQLLKHTEATLARLAELRSVMHHSGRDRSPALAELDDTLTGLEHALNRDGNLTGAVRPEWMEELQGSLKRTLLCLHGNDAHYLYERLIFEVDAVEARSREPEPKEAEPLGDRAQAELKKLIADYESQKDFPIWNDRACVALCSVHDQIVEKERLRRTRLDVRGRYMGFVAIALGALVGFLLFAIAEGILNDWSPSRTNQPWTSSDLLLAPIAGALGAVLSHMRRVRTEYTKIRQILAQALWAQVFAGAAAGTVLLLIARSPLNPLDPQKMPVAGWSSAGVLGFVGGFSEPFLINIVGRLTGIAEKSPAGN